jgi:Holliday junction resolvase RusA-like endonuclease
MAKGGIKTRKQREKEYNETYSGISDDIFIRLSDYLGEAFTHDLLQNALERIDEVRDKLTYSSLKFTFYEEPVQAHRGRVNYYTRNIHVPNAKDNKDAVKKLVNGIREDISIVSTPMKIKLDAYYPMPKDAKDLDIVLYETCHDYAIGKPDFDNILKAYCDMMIENIILDDDLVCSCEFNKFFSLKPRVELEIVYPDGLSSEYTYKRIRSRKTYRERADSIKTELIITPYRKKRRIVKDDKVK